MKVIYDDSDSEELTESEIQPLYMTTEQLSDSICSPARKQLRDPMATTNAPAALRPFRVVRPNVAHAAPVRHVQSPPVEVQDEPAVVEDEALAIDDDARR
eukprot:jgi/Tetstr1/463322/TSEL_008246.t1